MSLDTSILRKWDIRGIYPEQINENVAKQVGFAYAKFLKENNIDSCIVGRDNRIGGEKLSNSLIYGLTESGINVINLGVVTTPMLNFACHKLSNPYGIMITASHNPKNDNGFKVFGDKCLHLETKKLNHFYDLVKANKKEISDVKGNIKNYNIKELYIEDLIYKINLDKKRLKVVIDCGNGTASTIIRDVYKNFNCDVIYLYSESDPNFPNHHPDPNVFENLKDLCNMVKATNSDLGIAYDGDCDRVGIVDNNGNVLETDKLMSIYSKDIIKNNDNKNIIIDVKCSMALEDAIKRQGGNSVMVCNGSAYIETFVNEYPAIFGGEYSGHVFFNDKHYGYDDGIYAGLRLQEILCKEDKKLSELTKDYQKLFNTPEIKISCSDDKKFDVVENIKNYCKEKNYEYLDIDGVRVKFSDGWALVRASNTGPNLTTRFEATTEKRVSELKEEFINVINDLVK
ncbi:MAG: phosphomannomutase/phosphoglucomutase [Candidatus Aphodocola sp.]